MRISQCTNFPCYGKSRYGETIVRFINKNKGTIIVSNRYQMKGYMKGDTRDDWIPAAFNKIPSPKLIKYNKDKL